MHQFRELILVCLILSIFLLHCSVIGSALNRLLKLWESLAGARDIYLQWFFALSSGIMIDVSVLFLLGMFGYLNTPTILVLASLLMVFALLILFEPKTGGSFMHTIRAVKSFRVFDIISISGLFIIVVLLSVLRTPGHWDDTMYHLPLARFYLENQAIVLNEFLRFPLVPQNMDLLFALGLLIGGDAAAQGMATIPVFITSLGLIGCGTWLLGSTLPGFLSVLCLFYLSGMRETLGYAYVESGLALFSWGATLAIALWGSVGIRARRALIIAGVLAGGAAGTKILGGVLAVLLGLYLLIVRRDWGAWLTYAITTIAFGSWWYIRSAILSGDPIHPMGGDIFGYFLWNHTDLHYQQQVQGSSGGERNLLSLWAALHPAGAVICALAFLSGIHAIRKNTALRILYATFIMYFMFWVLATGVQRYLSPIFAVASFLSIYLIYEIVLSRLPGILMPRSVSLGNPQLPAALSLLLLIPAGAYLYTKVQYTVTKRSEMLQQRVGYALFEQANKLRPLFGPKLLQVGFENDIYFFDGIVIGDWFGLGRYSSMMTCSVDFAHSSDSCQVIPPLNLIDIMKRFDSRMLAVNTKRVTIDIAEYEKYFDLSRESEDGVLLTLR